MKMKVVLTAMLVLLAAGCSVDFMTEDNPLGFRDPNQGTAVFTAAQQGAGTIQTVGTVTGNPALIGLGAAGGVIASILGASYLKGKKK